jgi:hypothetical protein
LNWVRYSKVYIFFILLFMLLVSHVVRFVVFSNVAAGCVSLLLWDVSVILY